MKLLAKERIKSGQIICQSGFAYKHGKDGQGLVVGVAKFDCLQGGIIDTIDDFDAVMEALNGKMGRMRL